MDILLRIGITVLILVCYHVHRFTAVSGQAPVFYKCMDFDCRAWISEGKTLSKYIRKTEKHISFEKDVSIGIVSKPENASVPEWLVEVKGKVGFAPNYLIQEEKIAKSPAKFKYPLDELISLSFSEKDPNIAEDDLKNSEETNLKNPEEENLKVPPEKNLENTAEEKPEPTTEKNLENPAGTDGKKDEFPRNVKEIQVTDPATDSFVASGDQSVTESSLPMAELSEDIKQTNEASSPPNTSEMSLDDQEEDFEDDKEEEEVEDFEEPFEPLEVDTSQVNTTEKVEEKESTNKEDQKSFEDKSNASIKNEYNSDSNNMQPESDISKVKTIKPDHISTTAEEKSATDAVKAIHPSRSTHKTILTTIIENINKPPFQKLESDSQNHISDIETDSMKESQSDYSKKSESLRHVVSNTDNSNSSDFINEHPNSDKILTEGTVEDIKTSNTEPKPEEKKPIDIHSDTTAFSNNSVTSEGANNRNSETEDANSSEEAETKDDGNPLKALSDTIQQASTSTYDDLLLHQTKTLMDFENVSPSATPTLESDKSHGFFSSETKISENEAGKNSDDDNIVQAKASEFLDSIESNSRFKDDSEDSSSLFASVTPASSIPDQPESSSYVTEQSLFSKSLEQSSVVPESSINAENLFEESTYASLQANSFNQEDSFMPESTVSPTDAPVLEETFDTVTSESILTNTLEAAGENEINQPAEDTTTVTTPTENNEYIEHEHHHHHHENHDDHHHHASHSENIPKVESSFSMTIKHLSSRLVSLLPEYLQDMILDVDDLLVFTGILTLVLISICVPYFIIDGLLTARPLKKRVVELNKSLWKMSAAYENQQDEFEAYKKKALEYDQEKEKTGQLEYEVTVLKKLESKLKEQVKELKKELKYSAQVASQVENLVSGTMEEKNKISDQRDKLEGEIKVLKSEIESLTEEKKGLSVKVSKLSLDLKLANGTSENLQAALEKMEKNVDKMRQRLNFEIDEKSKASKEKEEQEEKNEELEKEMKELKEILHKYEDTVSQLTNEVTSKENELMVLKESLGEDSPLLDIADLQAKLLSTEKEVAAWEARAETLQLQNVSLKRKHEENEENLRKLEEEKNEATTRLNVLEEWFKQKEDELRKVVDRNENEAKLRKKDTSDLIKMIADKDDEIEDLHHRIILLKDELEGTIAGHKTELRSMDAKAHEQWLSLCQAERKAQDARKEAELLRQKLTAICKEKSGETGEMGNGDLLGSLPPELVPQPLPEEPMYFPVGADFMPPLPLPLDGEVPRPPPLGRISPNYSYSNESNEDDYDDELERERKRQFSPIHRRSCDRMSNSSSRQRQPRNRTYGGEDVASDSPDRSPSPPSCDRNEYKNRNCGPKTSSPIPHGFNL